MGAYEWENYFIDGTDVLKNKLGITNKQDLLEAEKVITFKKLAYLGMFPINGSFNIEHLKKLHHFIFGDVYPFAGELRKCSMARFRYFAEPEEIEQRLNEELTKMNDCVKDIQNVDQYAFFLAQSYYELLVIHPFREGNGRSIREFIREFVFSKNDVLPFEVQLDFSKMDPEQSLIAIRDRYIYPSLLEMLFRGALVQTNKLENDHKKL